MNKISVIIPTLQKNKQLLFNLLSVLDKDTGVDEIILIDNSLQGLDFTSAKLKLIIPEANLFVNPSWNLGVKEAKNEQIALLNDDITVPENFCSNIFSKITDKMGVVGYNRDFITETWDILPSPMVSEINLMQISTRCKHWGVAIFLYKSSYIEIPDEMKIYSGDTWLLYHSKKMKKPVYSVCGQEIYHYGSLSCSSKALEPILKNDMKILKKYTYKWWQYLFNLDKLYNGFRVTIFGLKFTIQNKSKTCNRQKICK